MSIWNQVSKLSTAFSVLFLGNVIKSQDHHYHHYLHHHHYHHTVTIIPVLVITVTIIIIISTATVGIGIIITVAKKKVGPWRKGLSEWSYTLHSVLGAMFLA